MMSKPSSGCKGTPKINLRFYYIQSLLYHIQRGQVDFDNALSQHKTHTHTHTQVIYNRLTVCFVPLAFSTESTNFYLKENRKWENYTTFAALHNIVHIHNNVMWDGHYSMEYSLIFPTFRLNGRNSVECC